MSEYQNKVTKDHHLPPGESSAPGDKGQAPSVSPPSLTPEQLDRAFGTYTPEQPPRAQVERERNRRDR